MPGIFISYRRQSTAAFAGRLFDRLTDKFGKDRIFIDIDTIEPGEDFVDVLERKLTDAVALLVLIGSDWLNCKDAHGQERLQNPEDFVRLEIATALRRNVRVIPVLTDGATMPTSLQLPDDLVALSRRQAVDISHARFHQDAMRLVTVLDKLLTAADLESERRAAEKNDEEQAERLRRETAADVLTGQPHLRNEVERVRREDVVLEGQRRRGEQAKPSRAARTRRYRKTATDEAANQKVATQTKELPTEIGVQEGSRDPIGLPPKRRRALALLAIVLLVIIVGAILGISGLLSAY